MTLVNTLTPEHTEEIKPGLFIQKTPGGYRQIYPAAWNGQINWKNFLLGPNFIKSLIVFIIILLVCYGYYESTHACDEFQKDPCKYLDNITNYCYNEYNLGGYIKTGDKNFNALQIDP